MSDEHAALSACLVWMQSQTLSGHSPSELWVLTDATDSRQRQPP